MQILIQFLTEALAASYSLAKILAPTISTFSGVFLGFLLGAWWQRRQRIQQDDRLRAETKDALLAELTGIHGKVLHIFDSFRRVLRGIDAIPEVDFVTDAKESAIASGRFTLLEVPLQTEVSHIFAVVGQAVDYRSRLLQPRLSLTPDPYPRIFEQFEEWLRHLDERIPPLVTALAMTYRGGGTRFKEPKPLGSLTGEGIVEARRWS